MISCLHLSCLIILCKMSTHTYAVPKYTKISHKNTQYEYICVKAKVQPVWTGGNWRVQKHTSSLMFYRRSSYACAFFSGLHVGLQIKQNSHSVIAAYHKATKQRITD